MQLPMALAWPTALAATGGPSLFVLRMGADAIVPTLVLGVVGLTSHYCLTNAFRSGDATVVVPLDFLRIPLIALVGWMFYGEALDAFVFAGAGLIICRRAVEPACGIAARPPAGGRGHGEALIHRRLDGSDARRPNFGHHSGFRLPSEGRALPTPSRECGL